MIRFWRGYIQTQCATTLHRGWVAWYLLRIAAKHGRPRDWPRFLKRALLHDLSKYRWDEASYFAMHIFDLAHTEYGTPEYRMLLAGIKPAIDRHYARNRHHPEHFAGGVAEMTTLDRIEMVADWKAATRRHPNGDLARSIRINADRFGYGPVAEAQLRMFAVCMGAL